MDCPQCKKVMVERILRLGDRRWVGHVCGQCGWETTEVQKVQDANEPITSDEILEVIQILRGQATVDEMVGKKDGST